jgi:hypothetical protein
MMNKLPFGKFIISAGIGMSAIVAFALYGMRPLESVVGENVSPYLAFVLLGVSVILVGFFNDRYEERITVPVGIVGWVIVLVMLFIHYSNQ